MKTSCQGEAPHNAARDAKAGSRLRSAPINSQRDANRGEIARSRGPRGVTNETDRNRLVAPSVRSSMIALRENDANVEGDDDRGHERDRREDQRCPSSWTLPGAPG